MRCCTLFVEEEPPPPLAKAPLLKPELKSMNSQCRCKCDECCWQPIEAYTLPLNWI